MKYNYNAQTNVNFIFIDNKHSELFPNDRYMFSSKIWLNINFETALNYFKHLEDDVTCVFLDVCTVLFWGDKWTVTIGFDRIHNTEIFKNLYLNVVFTSGDYYIAKNMCEKFEKDFEDLVAETVTTTNWASLTPKGEISYTTMDLKKFDDFHPEFYPFINDMNVDEYINEFIESSSNVLILTGDPGLGKSSFINYMLQHAKWNSVVAYDSQVMTIDDFYIDFISNDNRDVMVLEDADILLESRAEAGNKTMAKILNVSDGVINVNKKFIFTANIKNVNDIDEALIRPGRCYDIVQFRPLTLEEAENAAFVIGKTINDKSKKSYSVAEIYNSRALKENVIPIRKFGFR